MKVSVKFDGSETERSPLPFLRDGSVWVFENVQDFCFSVQYNGKRAWLEVWRLVPGHRRLGLHRNLRRLPETRCWRSEHLESCPSWRIRGAGQSLSMLHFAEGRAS